MGLAAAGIGLESVCEYNGAGISQVYTVNIIVVSGVLVP